MNQPESGFQGMRESTDPAAIGSDCQFTGNNHNHHRGSEFDLSALLGDWDADLDNLLMPLSDEGVVGYGYPVAGWL